MSYLKLTNGNCNVSFKMMSGEPIYVIESLITELTDINLKSFEKLNNVVIYSFPYFIEVP